MVRAEPDWRALPSRTPLPVRDLLRRCLQKDKTLRLQAAGDARIEIQEALATPNVETVAAPTTGGWARAVPLSIAIPIAALVAVITGVAIWNLEPTPLPSPRPESRFTITLPPGQQLAGLDAGPAVAISPDGTHLAYVVSQGDTQQLYVRAMDNLEAKPIPGTVGAVNPFFSPDGQWLGFFARGKAEKGFGERGSGANARRCCKLSWGQLEQSGHHRFRSDK